MYDTYMIIYVYMYIYIYDIYIYVRETFLYYLTAEDSFWISFKFNFYLFSQEL